MKIKICGLRSSEDVSYVNLFMPDYAGFILAPGFRRTVAIEDAKFFASKINKGISKVGIFLDQPVESVAYHADYVGLDIIQLHGNEDNDYISALRKITDAEIWNVFKVKNTEEIENSLASSADMILFDTYMPDIAGGTGKKVNTEILKQCNINRDYILAGGIDTENLAEILDGISPYGIDVSSGVETNGIKDVEKIGKIIKQIREI